MTKIIIEVKGGVTLRNLQQIMSMIPGRTDNRTVVNIRRKWYNPRVVSFWVDVEDGETNEDPPINPSRQGSV